MRQANSSMAAKTVFAVVLAAGSSSRFGASKQLEEYRHAPLVRRAVRLAESVCGAKSVLVTGHDWRAVFNACTPLAGFLAHNADYRTGLGGSIAAGVRAVAHCADAVLLMLADQPLIVGTHLEALIAEWRASPDSIVTTAFAETEGPPVLFPASDFRSLMALRGDRGARSILTGSPDRVRAVPFEPAALDVDRPEDLAHLP